MMMISDATFSKRPAFLLLACLGLACEGSGPGENIEGIEFAPVLPLTAVGQTVPLLVHATNDILLTVPALLTSSDTLVVVVEGQQATARANGTATITAEYRGFEASVTLSVDQIPAAIVKIAGDSQVLPAFSFATVLPTVRVLDSEGIPIPGVQVLFANPDNDGTGQSNAPLGGPVTTDAAGEAAVEGWRVGSAARPDSLFAQAGPVAATFYVFAVPGPAARVDFIGPWDITTGLYPANVVLAPPILVDVVDQFGNPTLAAVPVTIMIGVNPSGGTLSGITSGSAVSGRATFADLSIDLPGQGYRLVATSPGLLPDTTLAITVTP